ncbi:MAG: Do family serine endopeptidase [Steroidobacteraceae bacterium]
MATLFAACSSPTTTVAAAAATPSPVPGSVSGPVPAAPSTPLVRGLPDFSNLVEQVGPAVVNVTVIEKAQQVSSTGGSSADDPFGDFFRQFGVQPRQQNPTPSRGEGSGFIVSADGYILTNAHVVDNASKVTVKLTDRREFEAKVIGVDERTDVAVIKIDAKSLPVVRLGDPNKLRIGEWVVAIGSPFGFENSVTAGIVSGKFRRLPSEDNRNYVPFIQTDVAVNPGNSGGPLFNVNGEVVGINSQIYSNTQSYAGLSFAIPIDIANNVREQLVKNGKVSRGRIGVAIQEVNALLAENLGLDRPRGAAVSSVDSGGPADKAGIKPEDVILSVNGQSVDSSDQLPVLIAAVKPGTSVALEVWRDKSIKKVNVTVGEMKETTASNSKSNSRRGNQQDDSQEGVDIGRLGVSVRLLNGDEKQQLKTTGNVVVLSSSGSAAESGIDEGDVILGVNRVRISTVEELQAAIRASGRTAALLVQTRSQDGTSATRIVTVRLD